MSTATNSIKGVFVGISWPTSYWVGFLFVKHEVFNRKTFERQQKKNAVEV